MKFKDIIFEWLLIENKEEVYKKYFSDIDRDNFIRIIKADPKTSVINNEIRAIGPYSKILVDMYRKGNLMFEDLPKANEYLTLVYRYKIPVDASKMEAISSIYELVKDYIVKSEKSLATILAALNKDEYQLFANTKSWYIFIPKTEKAAAYLGVNTEWCTAWGKYSLNPDYKDRTNHYKSHANTGSLYIMINKENEADKYQLHFETDQFKNPADREISNRPNFFDERLELKQAIFPFVFKADLNFEEVRDGLSKSKNFLSESDYENVLQQFMSMIGTDNSLVSILANYSSEQEDLLLKFISDPIVQSVDVNRNGLEIEVKNLPVSAESYYRGLNYLKASKEDAYNYMSEYEYESYGDKSWAVDMLNGYLEKYYEKNVSELKSTFAHLAVSFDKFFNRFIDDIYDDRKIRDGYVDHASDASGASLESAYKEEIKRNENYLDIDMGYSLKTITFPIENLIVYLGEKDIKLIPSLESFIDNYMFEYDLVNEDNFEQPEHDWGSPTQEQMDRLFEEFFENLADDLESNPDCLEDATKFSKIYEKYFNNSSDTFENEFVKITIIDDRVDCEDGVGVKYLNKKTNETYNGFVKVDNIINYIQTEPLFENISFGKILSEIKKGKN
jgi:hypothetical protein